ncbi:hypothetical protein V2J09_013178 [Rumex salicifolius]
MPPLSATASYFLQCHLHRLFSIRSLMSKGKYEVDVVVRDVFVDLDDFDLEPRPALQNLGKRRCIEWHQIDDKNKHKKLKAQAPSKVKPHGKL